MKPKEMLRYGIYAAGWIIIAAVTWHSVEEIHYLKTFYPRDFTVIEAGWAALVELIKVALISFPILLLMWMVTKKKQKIKGKR